MPQSRDEHEFQQALDAIASAWNSGDLRQFMALHVEAGDSHYVSGGKVVEGHAAIGAMYAQRFGAGGEAGAMGVLRLDLVAARRIESSHAFVIGRFTLRRSDHRPEVATGVTTMLFQAVGSRWLILEDHSA